MKRYDIINSLIQKFDYKKYLEIGVQGRVCFNRVNCDVKTGVDPDPNSGTNHIMTSDEFFEENKIKWDIIFLDGLHHSDQIHKDIINSLDCLNEGGTIVVHDCNPKKYEEQLVPRQTKRWNGDVWKAIVRLRTERSDLNIFVIDTDEGCGIIRKEGVQPKLRVLDKINYKNLELYRNKWLNLKTVSWFNKWLKK